MGIETALIGLSVASKVYSGIKSGQQARQAREDSEDALEASKNALAKAREDLDINFYDSLSVNVDPFNRERDALLASSANIIDSAIQADQRGIGATAQSILAASQKAQQSVTKRLNKDLQNVELLKASEDARLRDEMAKTYLTESKGAAQAAQGYKKVEAQARQSQAEMFASAGQELLEEGVSLYSDSDPEIKINNIVNPSADYRELGDDVIDTIPEDWNDPGLGGLGDEFA